MACHLLSKAEGVDGDGEGLICHSHEHFDPFREGHREGIRLQKCGQTLMMEKLLVASSHPSLCSCLYQRSGVWIRRK